MSGFKSNTMLKSKNFSRRVLLGAAVGPAVLPRLNAANAADATSPFDLMRAPDRVIVQGARDLVDLKRSGSRWRDKDIEVSAEVRNGVMPVMITSPSTPLMRVCLRWRGTVPQGLRYLGDHWERGYGDLEWRSLAADRIMPWYFLASGRGETCGCGVRTGAAAMCFWQVDPDGVSLWLDVRNGGSPVELAQRQLTAAVVVSKRWKDMTAFRAAQSFCRSLCEKPRLAPAPVYGGNDWYYAYGKNTAEGILRDSELIAACAPSGANRPFMVIDAGWALSPLGGGPWNRSNARFPDMPALAQKMKGAGVKPGLWVRPLYYGEKLPESWRLASNKLKPQPRDAQVMLLDPSIPDVLARVREDVRGVVNWGFEMVKHDFTTFDILGRWGFDMSSMLTSPGWHFADRSKTTAEIVLALYRVIREAAGSALVIGCNTIGHLAAGLFELQRVGDDTSGREWSKTRKMGVNTLAFRMLQHNAFFAADADCVGLTTKIPWALNRQWLDVLARSGTPLFVSAAPDAVGAEQRAALKAAFAKAARILPAGEPLDWMETTTPQRWLLEGKPATYDWFGGDVSAPALR